MTIQFKPGENRGDFSSPQASISWPHGSIYFKGFASSSSLPVENDLHEGLKESAVRVFGGLQSGEATCLYRGLKSGSLVLPLAASLSSIEILAMWHNRQALQVLP